MRAYGKQPSRSAFVPEILVKTLFAGKGAVTVAPLFWIHCLPVRLELAILYSTTSATGIATTFRVFRGALAKAHVIRVGFAGYNC